ncbi:MAG TPA: glycosyltransferase family 4 protein [Rhizomicrobium sp.]|nr:glycosyltransferase family 4 protein [Rhizomicrobium sp.]
MAKRFSIGFPYVADRFGGSTASSLMLARALKERGHDVHVLVHGGQGRILDEASALGLDITRLAALTSVPGYARPDRFRIEQLLSFSASRAAIARLGLDIVHTNDIAMLRCWAMPSLATSTPLVAHWRSNFRDSWSVKAGLHIARTVIAVSRYSFEKLPAWVQAKTVVEYNAFDISCSSPERISARGAVRASLGIPADAALIGVFGNHIVRKRTHVLADILSAIASTADGRPVYGIACGARAEPYDTQLDDKIACFALQSRLFRPGFVRPVEAWMSACDAIIAPAIDEPLARSVLEAQALGIPVAVSTDGGLKELICDGENGLLCDPFDVARWIGATRRLIDDRALAAALAEKGRAVVAKLSPACHAERVSTIYSRLFHQPSRNEAA